MVKIKEKSSLKQNKALLYAVSFIVPVAVMLCAYLANGIFRSFFAFSSSFRFVSGFLTFIYVGTAIRYISYYYDLYGFLH